MGIGQTMLLGFIAGVTILIGMPLGRMRRPSEGLRVTLNALAVGVLLFLVWDVLSAAWEPIDAGLAAHHETGAGLGSTFGYGLLFVLGLSVGLLGLQQYEAWMGRRVRRLRARAEKQSLGPGAMASQELGDPRHPHLVARPPAGAADRRGHRPAQLRRGPRDRPGRRGAARSPWRPCW